MLIAAGAIILLLVAAASLALHRGLRATAIATRDRERGRIAEALLAAAPMQPILVRADLRLDMPPRIADLFGLVQPATDFDGLSAAGGGWIRSMPSGFWRMSPPCSAPASRSSGRCGRAAPRAR